MADLEHVWLVYYSDYSEFAVFMSELRALRHAVDQNMTVKRVPLETNLREWLAVNG